MSSFTLILATLAVFATQSSLVACTLVNPPQPPVNLGVAGNFAVLTKSGITDVPASAITGDIGASPITGAAIHVSCPEVTGMLLLWHAASVRVL